MNHSKKVIFCWIPSHIGIQGNDKADSLVKATLNMVPDKKSKIPYTDLKPKIRQRNGNNLFQVQTILKERKLDPDNTRREETILPGYTLDTLD